RLGQANTLQSLGDLDVREDRLEEARANYAKALPIYEQIGDRLGQANTLRALGQLALADGRLGEAKGFLEQAIGVREGIGDRLGMRADFGITGRYFMAAGDPARAVLAFEQSLRALPPQADMHGYRLSLEGQANAFLKTGLVSGAAACLGVLDALEGEGHAYLESLLTQMEENSDGDNAVKLREVIIDGDAEEFRRANVAYVAKRLEEEEREGEQG
ncbi:MAG TPA: tetratricopeptide repeat protein, partial [Candidatus Hydrogenedentes bacterium]|nr:tetratricopeptide repeat protein [Candidatus Hydrogenedentota bacterium]